MPSDLLFSRPCRVGAHAREIDDLKTHGMLAERSASETDVGSVAELPVDHVRAPCTPLVLESFTDMQDLPLLDPIHEVDATGWPNKK